MSDGLRGVAVGGCTGAAGAVNGGAGELFVAWPFAKLATANMAANVIRRILLWPDDGTDFRLLDIDFHREPMAGHSRNCECFRVARLGKLAARGVL